jgi:hypothetical protein
MALFTLLLEFDGGTYIAQLRSASARGAVTKYAAQLAKNEALSTRSIRKRLASGLKQYEPVRIDGIRNVWCCSASLGNKFALLNLVATLDG